LISAYKFIFCNTVFYPFDDLYCSSGTYVGGDKHFFKIIKHLIIYFRFTDNGLRNLFEKSLTGFFQTFIQSLLFLLLENFLEPTHVMLSVFFNQRKYKKKLPKNWVVWYIVNCSGRPYFFK